MERVDVIRIHFKMAATIIKKKWGGFYFGNQTFTWKLEQGNNGADLWPPTCRHQGTTWLSRIVYSPFSCWFSCLFIYLFIHSFIHSHDCRSADSHRLTSDPASVTGTGGERTWLENGVTCDDVLESDTRWGHVVVTLRGHDPSDAQSRCC